MSVTGHDDKADARSARDELEAAARHRLHADWSLSMSQRLALLHDLCRQIGGIAGSATRR